MRNESRVKKAFVAILLITILGVIALSATYAKYTSTRTATAKGTIAKWDIEFYNGATVATADFDVDLGSLYPGANGSFTVKIKNKSDVAATVSATLSAADLGLTEDQFSVTVTPTTSTDLTKGNEQVYTINWEWTYNVSDDADANDTTVGEAATGTAQTVGTITLTAVQKAS